MHLPSKRALGAALTTVAAATTLTLTAATDALAGPGTANNERVACGSAPADKDHSSYVSLQRNNVNMRTGPSTGCTSVGQALRGNRLDYHCWVGGSDNHTWTYLRDVTRNTRGWVRDDLLPNNGSLVHC